jgi:hypothetical protein
LYFCVRAGRPEHVDKQLCVDLYRVLNRQLEFLQTEEKEKITLGLQTLRQCKQINSAATLLSLPKKCAINLAKILNDSENISFYPVHKDLSHIPQDLLDLFYLEQKIFFKTYQNYFKTSDQSICNFSFLTIQSRENSCDGR